MGIADVVTLLGGIALFLFGMSLMGEGLKKVAGSRLELVLYKLSSTPLKGVLLGTGVTAVIQSSSATSVMVVGFVNSGMMKVRQAIGVIMGAIVGTSVTGWILCLSSLEGGSGVVQLLSTEVLTGVVAVIGIILRMFNSKASNRHVGEILLGFAVLMYGMSSMSGAVSPLRESEAFIRILTSFSNPILGILVGVVFTSILQSASAAVGILQALAVTGAITFEIALPIIMGIAIGAAVPVLLSALGANLHGKRTAFIYLLIDVLGVLIWSLLFYGVNAIVHFTFMSTVMSSVSIALMNTLFRLATVIVLLPCIGLMEKLMEALFPDTGAHPEEQDMDRLEERFLQHPALSIEQSRLVTNAMAQRAEGNLLMAMSLRSRFSDKDFRQVAETESIIDRYEDKLGTYLMKITSKSLSETQSEEVSKFLHTISDFERISDHLRGGQGDTRQKPAALAGGLPRAGRDGVRRAGDTEHRRQRLRGQRSPARRAGGAAGGDHRRPVRRNEVPPCGSAAIRRLYAESGLCVQRPADQLRARGRPLLQCGRGHHRAGIRFLRYPRVPVQRPRHEVPLLCPVLRGVQAAVPSVKPSDRRLPVTFLRRRDGGRQMCFLRRGYGADRVVRPCEETDSHASVSTGSE